MYVYKWCSGYLWIDRYRPLFILCTAMYQVGIILGGGCALAVICLCVKVLVIHRWVYPSLTHRLMGKAQAWFSTGLISVVGVFFADRGQVFFPNAKPFGCLKYPFLWITPDWCEMSVRLYPRRAHNPSGFAAVVQRRNAGAGLNGKARLIT